MVTTFDELIGRVITKIDMKRGDDSDKDLIRFHVHDGGTWTMQHFEDCCESVDIEDIEGDINDLIDSPITMAESVSFKGDEKGLDKDDNLPSDIALRSYLQIGTPYETGDASYTWTFYKFATRKGYVTIRWYGSSEGYYSEEVDFSPDSGRRW